MADTRTPASRRAASSASASRLPSARERRPALAALAVLLIVGGAFASGFLALQAGNRADYLRVTSDLAQGAEITDADLESVSLPEDMDGGVISADDRDDVVGTYAVTPLLAGTILTDKMVDDESAIPEGKESVAFGLDRDRVDGDLNPGASINVYAVSEEGEESVPYEAILISTDSPEGDGGVSGDGGTSTVLVKVLMDSTDAAEVQAAIDDDRITITETAPQEEADDSEGGE